MSKFKIFLLITFLFNVSYVSYCQTIEYGNNKLAGKYYDLNGIKMYCEIYGKGEPLLLLHGNGGSISSFKKIIPYFSKKYKVIAVDSRAHGKSIDLKDSLSFEMMADDFNALLKQLKLKSAYVFGWSDGGINALILAIRHPKKVKKLASTGANIFVDNTAFMPGLYDELQKGYNDSKNKKFTNSIKKNKRKVFLLDVFEPKLTFEDLNFIKCPTLIISGDKDIISLEHTVNIFRNIKKAQLWVVPNSGHCTFEKNTLEFCEKVNSFFKCKK
jgi:pimeloyl-ACP methyl ester carboxylesterase